MKPALIFSLSLLLAVFSGTANIAHAVDGAPKAKPGLKNIQLVTDVSAVTPGETFTVALVIDPLPGYHTYWRGPGIVGVATSFKWSLPTGFSAGEVAWPPPQKVTMAGITAYGYRDRQMLLTRITPPQEVVGDTITLGVRIAWMACATSCNPGVDDFTLTLPVHRASGTVATEASLTAAFEAVRASLPVAAPANWKIEVRNAASDRIELQLTLPGKSAPSAAGISFFCDDMQVDSDEAQKVEVIPAGDQVMVRLHLIRPEVAPRSPSHFSGVLFSAGGWPGLDSPYLEISVPWPAGTFPHE